MPIAILIVAIRFLALSCPRVRVNTHQMIHLHIGITSEGGNVTSIVYSAVHESNFSVRVFCRIEAVRANSLGNGNGVEQRTTVGVHPLYFDFPAIWGVGELAKVEYEKRQAQEVVWRTYNTRFIQVCLEFVVIRSRTRDSYGMSRVFQRISPDMNAKDLQLNWVCRGRRKLQQ